MGASSPTFTRDHRITFTVKGEEVAVLEKLDEKAKRHLIWSLSAKLDRIRAFYGRLAASAGFDAERVDRVVPRGVDFNVVAGGWQHHADAERGTINFGYNVLLNDYGFVMFHETYHLFAEGVLGKSDGGAHATPLNEGLADYFAAVSMNQPQAGKPTLRRVKNRLGERALREKLRADPSSYHAYGQLMSGMLWRLRKAVNRVEGTAWSEVSYVDRLALRAHQAYTDERLGVPESEIRLASWVHALVQADVEASGGRYGALIREVAKELASRHAR